ncbi:MAG: amidohydrolase family protein [Pyrinomonadaceae bacterium]
MFTLIENGEVYGPDRLGRQSVLIALDRIVHVGDIDRRQVEATGLEVKILDAGGCYVVPGFMDPHEHLLGGSGEEGFASQTPEITAGEIISAGITSVVGCLGADTTTKTLPGLLAKVKALKEEGLNAFMWTGGYEVPTPAITDKAPNDLMFIDEVIGIGEIAVADERSSDPNPSELAKLMHETYVAGTLSKKSGLTHIHIGKKEERLALLRDVVKKNGVRPDWLYVTHITRSEELMKEAIELAKDGAWVDMDTVDRNLPGCLANYLENTGWPDKLTISTDASKTSPHNMLDQIRACYDERVAPLETLLRFVTANTAEALKLPQKGGIAVGKVADILIVEQQGFVLRDVICQGRILYKDGRLTFREQFLEGSNRKVTLTGNSARA